MGRMRDAGMLLLAAAAWGCDAPTETVTTGADQARVQVAVYGELMEREGWEGAAAWCLSVGAWETRQDPDGAVLGAFSARRPPVVPGSACTVSALEGTIYEPTGERGQTFHIETVELRGGRASAEAMWQIHGLGAGGYRCELERDGAGWRVEECQMTWIA